MSVKPYPGTQSVRRALSLLKVFHDERPEWRLSEIARASGLNKTTAYRLLTALEAEGMLTRAGEIWRLGNEAVALGASALRSNDLLTIARSELKSLVRETGETATLEILSGDVVVIVDGVAGPALVGASSEVGTRWPAHATSTGKALLAAGDAARGRRSLGLRRLPRLTQRTITDRGRLERELEQTRARGYATAFEELEAGYAAVGAAVRDRDGRAVAAISVGGPTGRLTRETLRELGPRVVAAADRISRRLGAADRGPARRQGAPRA